MTRLRLSLSLSLPLSQRLSLSLFLCPLLPAVPLASAAVAKEPVAAPSFRHDIAPTLAMACGSALGCHGQAPSESVHLDLRPAAAWGQLVGRPAEIRKGALRIAPGRADQSFLVAKLLGQLRSGEGKPMPIDAESGMPILPNPLRSWVEQTLIPWINAGARDDSAPAKRPKRKPRQPPIQP